MFSKLIRRNLIAVMLPVLIMEFLVLYMTFQLSLLDDYKTYVVSDTDRLDVLYLENKKNIAYDLTGPVEYAGYDVKAGDEKKGTYYYVFEGNRIQLFILTDATARKLNSGNTVTVYARLVEDKVTASFIEQEYSEEAGLGEGVFDEFVKPMIIDELSYPGIKIKGLVIVNKAAKILLIVSFCYFILAIIFPIFGIGYSRRKMFKSRASMIRIMNDELGNHLKKKKRNVYITSNYVVYAYISRLEVFNLPAGEDAEYEIDDDDIIYDETDEDDEITWEDDSE